MIVAVVAIVVVTLLVAKVALRPSLPCEACRVDNRCDCAPISGGLLEASQDDVIRRCEVAEARWGSPQARHRLIHCHLSAMRCVSWAFALGHTGQVEILGQHARL